ncbi:auxin-induced protein 22D-like [Chenopodium quinoa]|uniref:auxin-induced protein 22D-like n=1 Tax=Chenopodium quinoa TaxID=63459 RepID=UPI000B7960D8|nr:auxin-induced protein 22D-like [Chenopodium quinoa]
MGKSNDNLGFHEDTELRLGLPGTNGSNKKKRSFLETNDDESSTTSCVEDCHDDHPTPPPKVQAIGWPPIRSYRKNSLQITKSKEESSRMYVKVSMDGTPYLRKVDLKQYKDYKELLKALEELFTFKAGKDEPTYEDKDGDWMLVGDVPWEMFLDSCKRLRLMKGSEAN